MQISLKKFAYKYEYLSLELQETKQKVEEYTKLWNIEIGKYYLEKKIEAWQNSETGELLFNKPGKSKKKIKPSKLKKLYRNLSSATHPDKGGSGIEFQDIKEKYEAGDYIGLIKHAESNNVEVELEEEDIVLFEETCIELENQIKLSKKNVVWNFFNGDMLAKKTILNGVEKEFNFTLNEKDYQYILNLK